MWNVFVGAMAASVSAGVLEGLTVPAKDVQDQRNIVFTAKRREVEDLIVKVLREQPNTVVHGVLENPTFKEMLGRFSLHAVHEMERTNSTIPQYFTSSEGMRAFKEVLHTFTDVMIDIDPSNAKMNNETREAGKVLARTFIDEWVTKVLPLMAS